MIEHKKNNPSRITHTPKEKGPQHTAYCMCGILSAPPPPSTEQVIADQKFSNVPMLSDCSKSDRQSVSVMVVCSTSTQAQEAKEKPQAEGTADY